MNTKKCTYYVKGMHCASCEIFIEDSLVKHQNVKHVKASLTKQEVTLDIDIDDTTSLHKELNELIKDSGYSLHTEALQKETINLNQLSQPLVIALVIIGLFLSLQKLGIVNFITANQITLPVVFLIGIIASLSTCMAVVGGLVLSLSSAYAKSDVKNSKAPLIQFHISRIISFFLLGGVIGALGAAFTLTPTTTFILSTVLFIVMLILGINLLDIAPFFRKMQIKMPKFIGKKALSTSGKQSYIAPIVTGIATFFLPCGFTQSMQVYSLTTGSFMQGALTMLVFAMGTLPVLAFISFASVRFAKGLQSKLFFRVAGFIVLFFAVFNFLGALAAAGIIQPIFNI